MKSINYFMYMHGVYWFLITFAFVVIFMTVAFTFSMIITNKIRIPETAKSIIVVVSTLSTMVASMFLLGKIVRPYNLGGIKKIYVISDNNKPQLTVWLTRIHSKKVGADYDQSLHCFDLETGKSLKQIEMSRNYHTDDYQIYHSHGKYAWGYSGNNGIQLLDLIKPELIADEKDFKIKYPYIGDRAVPLPWDYIIDPVNFGLNVKTNDSNIYRLNTDLTVDKLTDKIRIINYDDFTNNYQKNWVLNKVESTLGNCINKKGYKLSTDAVYLLDPEFIEEYNIKEPGKNKIWVFHKSSILGEYDDLISYVDTTGTELYQINLSKTYKSKRVKVLCTYSYDREILVFISMGHTFRSNIEGFTLIALRTDIDTGKVLEEIKYF